jgi:hypothetical protein
MFDALVVANGHYSSPRLPAIEGLASFPGAVSHTHDYRVPTPFAGKRVLVVGAAASGEDISRDVAPLAAAVLLSAAAFQTDGPLAGGVVQKRAMLVRLHADGTAEFADGARDAVDAVVFATGYHFTFPFLDGARTRTQRRWHGISRHGISQYIIAPDVRCASDAGIVSAEDNCVAPLYEHLFPPSAPSLAFIGLPWKVRCCCSHALLIMRCDSTGDARTHAAPAAHALPCAAGGAFPHV